ncbi:MAG: ABC transporter ATP-binding protein [Proteobacteria bacterium]|nr:ABC transporter ATP-binding protein [Pseudomonadota bacterium]
MKIDIENHFKNISMRFSFSTTSNRVVVLGPSGSGKSLLLKMIAGFFNPERGEITVNDRSLFSTEKKTDVPVYRRNIGYLPQEYTLFPNMTVEQNILYGTKVQRISYERKRFLELVDRFGIGRELKSYPANLSGGQKQRAALARILLIDPEILLLDEPFSALDTPVRESLRNLVADIADEMGITALFVTHDMAEAFVFGKETVHIENGKVIEYGERDRLFNRPVYVETARLLGFANILPIVRRTDNKAEISDGHVFSFKGDFGEEATFLCIRPDNIMFLRENKPRRNGLKENVVAGTIKNIYHHGRYVKIILVSDKDLSLEINVPEHVFHRLELVLGKTVKVSLKEESVVLCRKFRSREGV